MRGSPGSEVTRAEKPARSDGPAGTASSGFVSSRNSGLPMLTGAPRVARNPCTPRNSARPCRGRVCRYLSCDLQRLARLHIMGARGVIVKLVAKLGIGDRDQRLGPLAQVPTPQIGDPMLGDHVVYIRAAGNYSRAQIEHRHDARHPPVPFGVALFRSV